MNMKLFQEDLPEGLSYTPLWISSKQETSLVQAIEEGPWQYDLGRRTQQFGWRYSYQSGRIVTSPMAPPIPSHLMELGKRLEDELRLRRPFDQIIVNEYVVNNSQRQGIAAHRDNVIDFGPVIVTLSLLESWTMRFSRDGFSSIDVLLENRSIGVMKGESRYDWSHSIPIRKYDGTGAGRRTRSRRISVTFRTVEL